MKRGQLNGDALRKIDHIMGRIMDTERIGFENSSEILEFYYKHVGRARRIRKVPQTCMFPSCNRRTITHSHTIPRSLLKIIAENSHLITVEFDESENKVVSKLEGIERCTVFPGFCSEHETVFNEYENSGDYTNEKFIKLQMFRTICLEVFERDTRLNMMKSMLDAEINIHIDKIRAQFEPTLRYLNQKHGITLEQLKVTTPRVKALKKHIRKEAETLLLVRRLLSNSMVDIETGKEKLVYTGVQIDEVIPFAQAGLVCSSFTSHSKPLIFVINVLPTRDGTLILLASHTRDRWYLERYVHQLSSDGLTALSTLESCMVHGCDRWFLQPHVWDHLPETRRRFILKSIFDDSQSFLQGFEMSIFDELRVYLLEVLQCEMGFEESANSLRELYNREYTKLCHDDLPTGN